MEATSKIATDNKQKAAANYNIGNTYMEEKKYEEAVKAYKEALRKNPQDENAKYNLSYALQMLKKQQGGGGKDKNKNEDKNQQNKDNQDKNKDENKDQQNKDDKGNDDKKQDEQKQQEQKDEQGKDKEDKQQQHPEPQPSKLSEQQAEQLLNALQQEEKKLQDKMKKGKAVPVRVEKDW